MPKVSGSPSCRLVLAVGAVRKAEGGQADVPMLGRGILLDVAGPASLAQHFVIGLADREVRTVAKSFAPLPQHAAVDDGVGEVAALGQGALGFIVIVGKPGDHGPLDGTGLLPVLHGFGGSLDPAPHGVFIEQFRRVVGDGADVLLGEFERVLDAVPFGNVVGTGPHLAPGVCRSAAHEVRSLKHGGPAATQCHSQRRGQSGKAGSDHNYMLGALGGFRAGPVSHHDSSSFEQ